MALHEERPLTPLEQRVALLVAQGKSDADVSAELGLDAMTVEWHLARAFRKLGVRSRDDLAAVLGRGTGEEVE